VARDSNESITFRIESRKLKTLRDNALENQVSLNTLVNQILTAYTEWDMIAIKAGYATLPKNVLKELFNAIDEETLLKIAAMTADSSKDILLLMMGEVTLDAYFSLLKNRSKRSGFSLREYEEEGTRKLVIQHEMGRHWSVFFKAHHEQVIYNAGYKAKVEYTDNTLVLSVET
jgi:hypothetical protein